MSPVAANPLIAICCQRQVSKITGWRARRSNPSLRKPMNAFKAKAKSRLANTSPKSPAVER